MKETAKKELERMKPLIENVQLIKTETSARELLEMAKSYFSDGNHFFEKGKYVEAFEAAIISWAYLDAGLRLGVFKIDEKYMKSFTVE